MIDNLSSVALIEYLIKHQITLSVAESCTGGLLSKMITDVPGCSKIYPGGVCSYSNEMKIKWLNVKKETLQAHGAVSSETALEMAQGIRNATGSDYGISTTGVAGPDGGSSEKPVGTVYIAIAGEQYQRVEKLPLDKAIPPNRCNIQQQTAEYALLLLWEAVSQSIILSPRE